MLHFVHYIILCSFHGLKEWLYLQENLFDSLLKKDMPKYKIYITIIITQKSADLLCWFSWCRKRDLNPHDCNSHTDLNRARLPIPPFLHSAEDGTWTHTTAIVTRSLVLLVCQFRHFRFSLFFRCLISQLDYNIKTLLFCQQFFYYFLSFLN